MKCNEFYIVSPADLVRGITQAFYSHMLSFFKKTLGFTL